MAGIENSEYYGIQSKQASQTLPNNAPSPVKDYRPSTGIAIYTIQTELQLTCVLPLLDYGIL